MKLAAPLLALLPTLALAGEHTVAPTPFEESLTLDAVFLPEKSHALSIDPQAWAEFKILDVKGHGAAVAKGEAVLSLDIEGIDRKIADNADGAKLRKMALANAERGLANLETSTSWKLAVAERTYQRAKEDWAYFKEINRPLAEESAKRSLERAEHALEYQQEELAQLLKMYAEDDLTEETEEIILKRQKSSVDSAEFSLKRAEIACKYSLETELPRNAIDWEQKFKDAELAWTTAKETLPRALAQKRLEVKQSRIGDSRADEKEAELLADRKLMDLQAPTKGRVYYGEIRDGRWSAGSTAKFMKPGGLLPAKTAVATVVPDDTSLLLSAFVDEKAIGRLKVGQKGFLTPATAPRHRIAVTVREVNRYPGLDGTFHVELKPVVAPQDLHLVTGMKGKVKVVAYQAENALTVPAKALREEADGTFSVQIKLADGESEKRTVTPGAEANGKVEILQGLEAGQVVLLKDEEKK